MARQKISNRIVERRAWALTDTIEDKEIQRPFLMSHLVSSLLVKWSIDGTFSNDSYLPLKKPIFHPRFQFHLRVSFCVGRVTRVTRHGAGQYKVLHLALRRRSGSQKGGRRMWRFRRQNTWLAGSRGWIFCLVKTDEVATKVWMIGWWMKFTTCRMKLLLFFFSENFLQVGKLP